MIQIEDDDVTRISQSLHIDRRDPLGIRRYHLDDVSDEHVQEHAMEMMTGIVPMTSDMTIVELDPIASALLSHRGIDPRAVGALASAAGGIGLRDEDDDRIVLIEADAGQSGPPRSFEIILEDGISRYAHDGLRTAPLPATVLAAAPGMRLADIVSHPALDALGLVVASVKDGALLLGSGEAART